MPERAFNEASDRSLLAAHVAGASVRELAKSHGASPSAVFRAIERARAEREREIEAERQHKIAERKAKRSRPAQRERAALEPMRPELRFEPKTKKQPEPEPAPAPARLVRPKTSTVQRGRELTFDEYVQMRLDENARRRGEDVPDGSARNGTFRTPQISAFAWGPYRRVL